MNIEIVLLSHYYIINYINKIWGTTVTVLEPKRRERAHAHVSWNPSAIIKCHATRTLKTRVRSSALSAIGRTRADLAAQRKTLVFIIYIILFLCKPTLGGAVESKNMTFVVPKPFANAFWL
jgi:hypothetical protein